MPRDGYLTLVGNVTLAIAMGAASWIGYVRGVPAPPLVGSAVLVIGLLALSAIDLRSRLLPDWLTLPLIGAGLVQNWAAGKSIWPFMIGAAVGYLVIYALSAIWLKWRGARGIGLGDAKLLAAGGAWIGVFGLPGVLLMASVMGLLMAFAAMTVSGKQFDKQAAIPFGPFLALGIWSMWASTNL